jgi:hypothetical protein
MKLPDPIARLLDPGPARLPDRDTNESVRVVSGGRTPTGTIVSFNYDRWVPPWWVGPYRQDVPKR